MKLLPVFSLVKIAVHCDVRGPGTSSDHRSIAERGGTIAGVDAKIMDYHHCGKQKQQHRVHFNPCRPRIDVLDISSILSSPRYCECLEGERAKSVYR